MGMVMILFSLAGGTMIALAAFVIYSYVYPLILAKMIMAAFLQILD